MKKPLTAPAVKKKQKPGVKLRSKSRTLKSVPSSGEKTKSINQIVQQMKAELMDKIDQKFNHLTHRLDRMDDGIDEILDELRATEALLESETEPYEGQA
ncbi:MAG: hypothetical protein HY200_04430 [Nitrospirae bacterium]|nr:hypothetical protein [Nitrospirota bacterium]MBI3594182.1 hypothetical protein [Nitrospirota bacterium]